MDIPIERTIEREKIIEILVEKPVEKILEIPIEQIIEIPVEKIIEVPVENKVYVDKEYEKIVERPYEVLRENIIWRENVIDVDERDVSRYHNAEVLPTEIEYIHKEKKVDKPVYYDNVIIKEISIPV